MKRGGRLSGVFPGSREGRIRVVPEPMPWLFRFTAWVDRQIVTPRRTVRLLHWWWTRCVVRPLWMAWEFVAVQTGGDVDDEAYRERNEICELCDASIHHHEGVRWRRGRFCGDCGCPRWPAARLERKNRKRRWRCPRRQHPGTYPEWGCAGCQKGTGNGRHSLDIDDR